MGEKRRWFPLLMCVMMVITGALNTIFAKWSDELKADGVAFNHPFLQTMAMFFGMIWCMVAYFIHYGYRKHKWKKAQAEGRMDAKEPKLHTFNPLIFLLPSICDNVATVMLYVGLNLTTASSYQMLQGALIVCTGLLSILFFKYRIPWFKWFGMLTVIIGLVVVGVTDVVYGDESKHTSSEIMIGNILCVSSQIVVALQLVLEEKYLHQYDVEPLFAVGLEGIYGFVILLIALVPLYYIRVSPTFSTHPDGRLEDVIYAWKQAKIEPLIAVSLLAMVVSIAFFNFAAINVTKELTATTRTVIDTIRTVLVWAVSVPAFHAKFIPWQIIGFLLLILGMFIYNDIVIGPWFRRTFLPSVDDPDPGICSRCCFVFCAMDRVEKAEVTEDGAESEQRL
ncbi:putative membrane protein [Oesophagostomum dentatum]|uniref:Putative membrane protein n=1 Tax=Oesophagostomum dentatum TaxID=61180 RepID=A0A0B1T8W3_OESDE|nr:putative membrane protein [Oesophagostomum dentatum]